MLYNLFPKIKKEATFPNSFFETSTISIPKPYKDKTYDNKTKQNYRPLSLVKNPQQNISKSNLTMYKKSYTP